MKRSRAPPSVSIVIAPSAKIAGVGVYLPSETRSAEDTERRLLETNPDLRLASGLIRRLTGVRHVHIRPEGWQTSDLAVAAAGDVMTDAEDPPDLLIFASASQDLIEPATSHIVSEKLGLDCPVMDVKNACNSLLNGMQVAEALIAAGQYNRVLVASGEQPSHAVRWTLDSQAQFIRSFPGYTMSDGGAAVLLERTGDPEVGILGSRFAAHSVHWRLGTLATGGSMNPHAAGGSYFDFDGGAFHAAFRDVGFDLVNNTLGELKLGWDDLDLVAIHQVAVPYHEAIVELLGAPPDRTIVTVADHGNLASVTLPFQLSRAQESGMVGPGSTVALVGLAGGISLGVMVIRL